MHDKTETMPNQQVHVVAMIFDLLVMIHNQDCRSEMEEIVLLLNHVAIDWIDVDTMFCLLHSLISRSIVYLNPLYRIYDLLFLHHPRSASKCAHFPYEISGDLTLITIALCIQQSWMKLNWAIESSAIGQEIGYTTVINNHILNLNLFQDANAEALICHWRRYYDLSCYSLIPLTSTDNRCCTNFISLFFFILLDFSSSNTCVYSF